MQFACCLSRRRAAALRSERQGPLKSLVIKRIPMATANSVKSIPDRWVREFKLSRQRPPLVWPLALRSRVSAEAEYSNADHIELRLAVKGQLG